MFSAFVFKVQANMDPSHRDRLAFARICSGRFERGMAVTRARTGREPTTKYAMTAFGAERETVEIAYPGDVIGLVNASGLQIGDTVNARPPGVTFPPLPGFSPEVFATARPLDTGRAKQFRKGLEQLDEEGVVQVLRDLDHGESAPILAAVGALQFDVFGYRLAGEFGAPAEILPAGYQAIRRTDATSLPRLRYIGGIRGSATLRWGDRRPLRESLSPGSPRACSAASARSSTSSSRAAPTSTTCSSTSSRFPDEAGRGHRVRRARRPRPRDRAPARLVDRPAPGARAAAQPPRADRGEVAAAVGSLRARYDALACAFADCGTYGALDEALDGSGVRRLRGEHCYDLFAREDVREALDEEPGTYFLTDFLARTFEHTVVRELGLDRHPELRDSYFGNYRRVLWLAQAPTPANRRAAQRAAERLGLPLEERAVGDTGLERELERLVAPASL